MENSKRLARGNRRHLSLDRDGGPRMLSLTSRFHSITVEPFAFMSILALYLVFPATQDLFYTKICLQVIGSQPLPPTLIVQEPYMQYSPNGKIGRWPNHTAPIIRWLDLNKSITHNTSQNGPSLPMPHLAASELCTTSNMSSLRPEIREEISYLNSKFWLHYQLILCLTCAFTTPYWGGMSDKIGRIVPLNVPVVAELFNNSIFLLCALFIHMGQISVQWLFPCALVVGLCGGQGVIISNSLGYISDLTSQEERLSRIIIVESIVFLSNSVGFFVNGQVMKLGLSQESVWNNRHVVAFSLGIILNLASLLYSLARLRHCRSHMFLNSFEREQQDVIVSSSSNIVASTSISHTTIVPQLQNINNADSNSMRDVACSSPEDLDGSRVAGDINLNGWRSFATFKYYKDVYETLTVARQSRSILHLLLLAGFMSAASLAAMMSLFYNYIRRDPFNWKTSQYSDWNAISSFTRGAALVAFSFLIRFHSTGRNVPDALVAALGFFSKGLSLLMIGLAQSSVTLYIASGAMVFSELTMPPIRSLLSKLVAKDEVCKVYSCLATSQNLCFTVGNLVFYFAYSYVGYLKFFKLCFIIVGLIELCIVLILIYVYRSLRDKITT